MTNSPTNTGRDLVDRAYYDTLNAIVQQETVGEQTLAGFRAIRPQDVADEAEHLVATRIIPPTQDWRNDTMDFAVLPESERLYQLQHVTTPQPVPQTPERDKDHVPSHRRRSVRRVLRDADRAAHQARRAVGRVDPATLTLTIIVPAFNEEAGLPPTLDSLRQQTVPADKIIVVDDGSSDGTSAVAARYAEVLVIRHATGSGSKAMAQNLALPACDTDLILTVDADTVLRPDFIEQIKKPFADPQVSVVGANVQVLRRHGKGRERTHLIERGREIEYLFGLHFYRPVQNMGGAPVVCSGCASALRTSSLVEVGGFPKGTIAEDMDYTWSLMLNGHKAVYATNAECYVQDPKTFSQLRTQVHRWMSGYMQNIRIHWKEIVRRKKLLALWAALAVIDICSIPLWLAAPVAGPLLFHTPIANSLIIWLGIDLLLTMPVVAIGVVKRRVNPIWALVSYPCIYINRLFNAYYAVKAASVELVFVPLGWAKGLQVFKKGH